MICHRQNLWVQSFCMIYHCQDLWVQGKVHNLWVQRSRSAHTSDPWRPTRRAGRTRGAARRTGGSTHGNLLEQLLAELAEPSETVALLRGILTAVRSTRVRRGSRREPTRVAPVDKHCPLRSPRRGTRGEAAETAPTRASSSIRRRDGRLSARAPRGMLRTHQALWRFS